MWRFLYCKTKIKSTMCFTYTRGSLLQDTSSYKKVYVCIKNYEPIDISFTQYLAEYDPVCI